ncbi:hypothetical protein [Ktedonobacter racemifer]|nr:hypothetical protein [Ktedonobacter racemifer]
MAQSEVSSSDKNTRPSKHPLHVRELLGYMQEVLGGGTIIGLNIVTVLLWFLFRPAGQPTSRYLGEMLGTTAIVLFSCSLILATKAPVLERFFGGLDRIPRALAGQHPKTAQEIIDWLEQTVSGWNKQPTPFVWNGKRRRRRERARVRRLAGSGAAVVKGYTIDK